MKQIKVKTPAKINLTLEILNKRPDGFHNLQSIMQAISLYDFLTVRIDNSTENVIELTGNSDKIPYDETNIVHKAVTRYIDKAQIKNTKFQINIEKHIPVAAGLAGGSANAAGVLYALNKLFNNCLTNEEIDEICASLGSDVNFCLKGGCALCTSRGEETEKLPFYEQAVSIIKPKNLGISTKEAYKSFSELDDKSILDNTTKLKQLLLQKKFDKSLLYNSFEKALFPKYNELKKIKDEVKNSLMSGSGSTFFVLESYLQTNLDRNQYEIFENLKTIPNGAEEINE